jgi:2-polyprenyl-3-methyl-5-hydroxy-6-metoxy-1,4-benzoquinol methylase
MTEFTLSLNGSAKIPAFEDMYCNPCPEVTLADSNPPESFGTIWGYKPENGFNVTSEYGFFFNAAWIDRVGIYCDSSIGTAEGKRQILAYSPPQDLVSTVVNSSINTKYPKLDDGVMWNGVVLAGQNPMDCNIAYNGTGYFDHGIGYERYIQWYLKMCAEYKERLFVKLHPFVASEPFYVKLFEDLARPYGCTVGVAGFSIFDHCEKVVTYSSTIILDCWMRDIPVEQHGPGFFQSYTASEGKQLANFLMWKFCTPLDQSRGQWFKLWKEFKSNPDQLYPIPEQLSWGQWFVDKHLDKKDVATLSSFNKCAPLEVPSVATADDIVSRNRDDSDLEFKYPDMIDKKGAPTHRQRYEAASSLIKRDQMVLDIGCGYGLGCHVMGCNNVFSNIVGVDFCEAAIVKANAEHKLLNVEFVHADVTQLEPTPETIDLITMFEVLEHVKDPNQLVAYAAKTLVKGGRLLISTPNGALCDVKDYNYHIQHFTMMQLKRLLKLNGLRIDAALYQTPAGVFIPYETKLLFVYCSKL